MIANILISFFTSLVAVLIALWIEKLRQPLLKITIGDEANHDSTYPDFSRKSERWKFFRVKITNKKFPFLFKWIPRYTALNCSANITFVTVGSDEKTFSMSGRWASTVELAYLSPEQKMIRIFAPDPVAINPGCSELLDIFTKSERDNNAFAWNNETYLAEKKWRHPRLVLDRGKYKVVVSIQTQNGIKFSKEFLCQITDKIEDTYLIVA